MIIIKRLQILYLTKKLPIDKDELIMLDVQRLGVNTDCDSSVVKLQIKFKRGESTYHKPIIFNPSSPYTIRGKWLCLGDRKTSFQVLELIEDTPRHYYFRGNEILVINSTFLNPCDQGCKFCEQTNASPEKRRYSLELFPKDFFDLVEKENSWNDLAPLKQISIITSCAGTEEKAIELVEGYIYEARRRGFDGKTLFATNEIRTREGLEGFAKIGNVILAFTVECFANRTKHMPGKKGQISLNEIKNILFMAKDEGIETTFFYIFGLDNHREMKSGFKLFKDAVTIAPTGPNYQPQGKIVPLKTPNLEYFLRSKSIYSDVFAGYERFESVQNYRSLWSLDDSPDRIKVNA